MGCLIVHILLIFDVFIWITLTSSWQTRHPGLAILLFFIIFAITSYIGALILDEIDLIHDTEKGLDKTSITLPEKTIVRPSNPIIFPPQKIIQAPSKKGYTAQQICAMNWREFEFFIAKVLNEHDYTTRVTAPRNDGGKDIIATRGKILFYIECKHWQRQSVGREVLQKLVGAAAANNVREIIFITTSSYADTGIQYKYELNRAGTFHLQLWSMRDILALANHTPLSVRSLRTLSQRNDKITSREGDIIYYSFGHPSTRCSIDVKLGNIYIDDQNRFSHMPYQSFHMSNTWDYCLSKNIFFEEIRSPDRPDLIYFHTDAKHGRFESVRIIGCYGGRIQELFNPYVDELNNLGENCSVSIKDTLGETYLVISGSKNTVALQWNGSEYVIQQSTRGRMYS